MGSAEMHILRICSWTDRICVTLSDVFLWLQLLWSLNTSQIRLQLLPLLWLIKTAQLHILTRRWQWIKKRAPDLFWTIQCLNQNRENLTSFFFFFKQSHINTASCQWIGTSDKTLLPCYYTQGGSFARKTLDPRTRFPLHSLQSRRMSKVSHCFKIH